MKRLNSSKVKHFIADADDTQSIEEFTFLDKEVTKDEASKDVKSHIKKMNGAYA
jgi:hypothetical protein